MCVYYETISEMYAVHNQVNWRFCLLIKKWKKKKRI